MIIQGWHGAHRWQGEPEIRAPKQGRYEYGCGLYLTNIWSRAARYAKGGGQVLRISIEVEKLSPSPIGLDETEDFVRTCPGLRNRKQLIDYIRENEGRDFFPEYLNNLCVNEEALTKTSAPLMAEWLSKHGLPYTISYIGRQGGIAEEWMTVFDLSAIKKIEVVKSADLDRMENYEDRNFSTFSEQISCECEPTPFNQRP